MTDPPLEGPDGLDAETRTRCEVFLGPTSSSALVSQQFTEGGCLQILHVWLFSRLP